MYIKKIRRKCGNRGCKNTENVYALSKTREMGNSVIICEECMRDALKTIDEAKQPIKVEKVEEPVVEETVVAVEEQKETKPKTKQSKSK